MANTDKALDVAEKIEALLTDTLRPLKATIKGWPPEFRVIIWEALAVIASRHAQEARGHAWDHPSNRSYEPVEKRAKEIYAAFEYDGPPGTIKPEWTPGGNGIKQDEARQIARREMSEGPNVGLGWVRTKFPELF